MSLRKTKIEESVAAYAKSYGNKAANLIQLSYLCVEIMKQDPKMKVQIPFICPLPHNQIFDHLSKYAPRWKLLWNEFLGVQKPGEKDLSERAKEISEKLQKLILTTFTKHPLPETLLKKYLNQFNKTDLLMVRSTGKEDSKELANPGGNESVAAVKAEKQAISKAIGVVVASYFSEKSLKQRLLGKDDITQDPFMPVLLQKMEGEILGGANKNDKVIRSGVMYTGKRGTRIQVAPGHGELIVNSKAPFDSIYVSREGIVHSEIHQKPLRLIPKEIKTSTGVKRILELTSNPKALRNAPSLSNAVVLRLSAIGQYIEDHYGEPMDVEFVYDPSIDVIHIVQARPIPIGELHLFPPSSIRPDKLTELKATHLQKGSVITPGGSAAKVITSKSEIIVCQTIEEALTQYLSQRDSKVKAVIIKNDAPETSHEAAQFNSKAIPVLRMDDITQIQTWLDHDNLALIVDPQRKQVVDVSKLSTVATHDKAKAIEREWIEEGIFKSTLSTQETLYRVIPDKKFTVSTFFQKPKKISIGKMLDDLHSSDATVASASFNNLMQTLYEVIKDVPKKTANFKEMPHLLEEIENATVGADNTKAIAALQIILNRFVSLARSLDKEIASEKESKIVTEHRALRKSLFKQAMITSAEIFHALHEMSDTRSHTFSEDKEKSNEIKSRRIELLNLVAKLEAMISAPAVPGYLSSSLYQWAEERKLRKKAHAVPGFETLTQAQQEYFIAMLQLKNVALNKPISEAWTQFALRICQDGEKILKLADLIMFMQKFAVSSDWINECFILKKRDNTTIRQQDFVSMIKDTKSKDKKMEVNNKIDEIVSYTFENIMKEVSQTKNELEKLDLDKKAALLSSWEQKLTQFSDEEKFPNLWKAFNAEIIPLIDQLDMKENMQTLTKKSIINVVLQLTEVIDHSIKSMKGSSTYINKEKQVENFYNMLEPYLRLMKKWVEKVPDEVFDKCSAALTRRKDKNTKQGILTHIDNTYQKRKNLWSERQLLPSDQFAVSPACFDSGTSFARHFVDFSYNITLEDLFSLMHQNILSAMHQMKAQFKTTPPAMPETLQPLITAIEAIQCEGNKPKLLKTEQHYPLLYLEYNLPLRNHSAKFLFIYDQVQGTCKFQAKYFGHNQRSRMDIIADMANLFPVLNNIKTINHAIHNKSKRIVDFTWEFSLTQLAQVSNKLKDELTTFANITFYERDSNSNIESFINKNIASRRDLTLKQVLMICQSSHVQDGLTPQAITAITESSKSWSKSEWIDVLTMPTFDISQHRLMKDLFEVFRKSLTRDDLHSLETMAKKMGKSELFDLLPGGAVRKIL